MKGNAGEWGGASWRERWPEGATGDEVGGEGLAQNGAGIGQGLERALSSTAWCVGKGCRRGRRRERAMGGKRRLGGMSRGL